MSTVPSKLNGLFKEAYGDDIMQLVPEVAKIVKMVPFVQRDKETGNKYHQPVIVANENGFTFNIDGSAFTLNDSISMQTQDAQVTGAELLLRSSMSYQAASRASNSKKAFVKATELQVENMMESATKVLEITSLYGGSGLAKLASSTNQSATKTRLVVSAASWAVGIWSGMEGAKLDAYNATSKVNSNAALVIDSIDADNRYIVVTGNASDITALDSAISSNPNVLDLFFFGAYGKEQTGIDKIITNTTSLFNIDAGVYNLWKGNAVTTTGALTMAKILSAVSKAVGRGLNEKVVALVNPDTWSNLNSDLAALRMYDQSYDKKKSENGSEAIVYHGQNGEIEVISHNCVKAGECFIFPPKRLKRLGSTDLTFKTPGREEEIFTQLAGQAGFEIRLYSDQAIFIETPARCVKISGFTNA